MIINETLAKKVNVTFKFLTGTSTTVSGNNNLTLTVNPLKIYNMVPMTSDFTDVCTAGNTRLVRFIASDFYNNKVIEYLNGDD